MAKRCLDRGHHLVEALAHVQPVGGFERRRHAELGDELGQYGIHQDLAVGNDAVEIKR